MDGMRRRALLATLVPLTAGCFSATGAESPDEAESQPSTPTDTTTPAATPTPEETSTPTETPDQISSDERLEARETIDTAEDHLREAVYIYTGGVSNALLDVSADAAEFDDRAVLLKLSEAVTAMNEAERTAVTDQQAETVDSLREMHRFLTQATDLQAWLIDGHEAVADAYDAIDDGDDESSVEAELEATKRVLEGASGPLDIITKEIDPASTDATDAIGREEYKHKRTQFENEYAVLEDLYDALSTIQSSREELDAARAKADKGDYLSAESAAERSVETLEETVDTLEGLDEDTPSRADAFEGLIDDVLTLAQDYETEAEDLHDMYD